MFKANREVSTRLAITRSARNVPTIETTPMSSGIPAATTPLNTIRSRIARIGKAISSALVRSSRVWSLTSLKLAAKPPIDTWSSFEPVRFCASSAASPPSLSTSWVERCPATTRERPSRAMSERPARGSARGSTTRPTYLAFASSRLRRRTSRRTAGRRTSSRPPSLARTRRTMPGLAS